MDTKNEITITVEELMNMVRVAFTGGYLNRGTEDPQVIEQKGTYTAGREAWGNSVTKTNAELIIGDKLEHVK